MSKKNWVILIAVILVIIIGVVAIFSLSKPKCQCEAPSAWSKCDSKLMKIRINYRCGADNNYTCASYEEEQPCQTELKKTGSAGLGVTISPVLEDTVKGIIKVNVDSLPSDAAKVMVMMGPQGMDPNKDPFNQPNVIVQFADPVIGSKVMIDTKKLENGIYNMGITSSKKDPAGGFPWSDVISLQLVVEN